MKSTLTPDAVVVATDGSDDAHRAVQWAAEQAYLERRPLTVVTAVGTPSVPAIAWAGIAAAYAYQPEEMREHGRAVAEEGVAIALHLRPALKVEAMVVDGDPRQALVDLSRHAHLLVLGSRGRGAVLSKLLGSVSAAVSRDAACPVVVCRPRDHRDTATLGVLVGADGTVESLPVIEFAFHQASQLGLPLTVVHCVWDEIAAAHGPVTASPRETGLEEQRLLLSESVAGMATKFPEVSVSLRLAHGIAEDCLSERSSRWDLIVVGRHPVETWFQLMTGAVATVVIERAKATVAMVPQSAPAPQN